jgi:hypothetical protein
MIDKFLKEQNIKIGGTWVCEDTKGNVRTVDIKQLLEDYHEWKVKEISSNSVLSDSLVAYQKWCYEHPEYDQVTETPKVEIYLKATNVR